MQYRGLLQHPKFRNAAFVAAAFTVLYLIWNFFVIGGDAAIQNGNTIISTVAALFASAMFFRASRVAKDSVSQPIWLAMGLGFGLWGLADGLWAAYSMVLQTEVPVPSLADFFWLIAYIPLTFALVTRYRKLKTAPTRTQWMTIILIILGILVLTAVFVVRDILADYDPQRAVEAVVNLLYPLGDLVLFVLCWFILVLLQEGRFALSWRLIATGTLVMTLSDLLYSFAGWHNLYYPDGRAHPVSILIDTSYTISYIIVGLGVYLYGLVWDIKEKFAPKMEFAPATRLYAFLATDAQHRIIQTSENFYCLVNGRPSDLFLQYTLVDAFGLSPAAVRGLFEKIIHEGKLYYEPLKITTRSGDTREIWLIAEANYDPQRNYAGSTFVFIADLAVADDLRQPKNRDILRILNYQLEQAGSRKKDETQEMRAYFQETIRLLSSILYQFGGPHYQDALVAEIDRSITQKNLPVTISKNTITIAEELQSEALVNILSPLLKTAREFVVGYVGNEIVSEELDDMERQMNPGALRDLDKYHLRAYHQVF